MSEGKDRPRHAIGAVERRTGLSVHTLRAWEKRYGAVQPFRTEGGHRLYSEEEVRRLRVLAELTEQGHRIGSVATVPMDELEDLLEATRRDAAVTARPPGVEALEEARIRELMRGVRDLDTDRLEAAFRRAAMERSAHGLIEGVIAPFLRGVGRAWEEGEVSPAQEHLASRVVSRTLAWVLDAFRSEPSAPLIVVATPRGQRHELGALLAAATAAARGWRIAYLGGDLPGEEIAGAARATDAQAVGLSIVYPSDDPSMAAELRALRAGLGPGTAVLVGGAGAEGYAGVLEEIGGRRLDDYPALRAELEVLAP